MIMPWSTVLRFSDPLACQNAIQGIDAAEVLPTEKGRFDNENTKIRFDRLWMQRFRSSLPQVITITHKSDRRAITFLTESKSPTMQYCGIEAVSGDIVINRCDVAHWRFHNDTRYGAMSLPTDELNAVVEAITGREFSEAKAKYIVRPNPELMSRLLKLHEGVGHLARDAPDILEQPEVGRALEEQLIHLMVRCLAVDAPETTAGSRRHDAIMVRLEEFLEANPDQPLYLTDISAGIGVSERTLRGVCEEHLGMGPIRFLTLRRMHLVRRSLLRADKKGTNVTRVVTDHGFWELGRFSVAYRKLFGESPSETLRRPAEQPETDRDRPTALPIDLAKHLNRR
jgi:AraC-like DNA-binding protein